MGLDAKGINLHRLIQTDVKPMYSSSEFGVLDVVPSSSLFNYGINPHVEFSEAGACFFEFTSGTSIGVHVSSLSEEIAAKTLVRVVKNAVLARVAERSGVFDVEGNLPNEVTLGSLGATGLLCFLVPGLAGFFGVTWLNSSDAERGSEGAAISRLGAEELFEAGPWEGGPSLVDSGHSDGGGGSAGGEGGLFAGPVIGDLAEGTSKSGGTNECHNVGVVAEGEDLLGA